MTKHAFAAIGIGVLIFAVAQIALHATMDPESAPSILLGAVSGFTSALAGVTYWYWACDRRRHRGR